MEKGPQQNLGSAWKMGMEAAGAQKLPATHMVPQVPVPSVSTCPKGLKMTTKLPPELPVAASFMARDYEH